VIFRLKLSYSGGRARAALPPCLPLWWQQEGRRTSAQVSRHCTAQFQPCYSHTPRANLSLPFRVCSLAMSSRGHSKRDAAWDATHDTEHRLRSENLAFDIGQSHAHATPHAPLCHRLLRRVVSPPGAHHPPHRVHSHARERSRRNQSVRPSRSELRHTRCNCDRSLPQVPRLHVACCCKNTCTRINRRHSSSGRLH